PGSRSCDERRARRPQRSASNRPREPDLSAPHQGARVWLGRPARPEPPTPPPRAGSEENRAHTPAEIPPLSRLLLPLSLILLPAVIQRAIVHRHPVFRIRCNRPENARDHQVAASPTTR